MRRIIKFLWNLQFELTIRDNLVVWWRNWRNWNTLLTVGDNFIHDRFHFIYGVYDCHIFSVRFQVFGWDMEHLMKMVGYFLTFFLTCSSRTIDYVQIQTQPHLPKTDGEFTDSLHRLTPIRIHQPLSSYRTYSIPWS